MTDHTSDEPQLIARAAGGDDDALGVLLERYAPGIGAEISGRIPNQWRGMLSADDVLQETFLDAFLDFARFMPVAPSASPARSIAGTGLNAWLSSIARCNLVDALRMLEADKRGGDRRRIADAAPPGGADDSLVDLLDMLSGTITAPSARARRTESAESLRRAVAELSEPHRTVVQLYDLQARPAPEVAAAIGRREGAMFMLRARAHRQLAERLGAPAEYLSRRA
jgi:RNA polymerase sigma-70 factor (ECF subfamily)